MRSLFLFVQRNMKTTTTLAILSIIVFACHRRTVAASDDIIISNKTEITKSKATTTAGITAGQTIYNSRCGRCHRLKTVQDFTAQQWNNILKSMVPKARLNQDEAEQLTAYVMDHAKK